MVLQQLGEKVQNRSEFALLPPFFFFLPKHKPIQLLVSGGLRDWGSARSRHHCRRITATRWWVIGRETCGPESRQMKFDSDSALLCQSVRQAGVDWFSLLLFFFFQSLHLLFLVFKPLICRMSDTHWYRWNQESLLCCFSRSDCTTEGLQLN